MTKQKAAIDILASFEIPKADRILYMYMYFLFFQLGSCGSANHKGTRYCYQHTIYWLAEAAQHSWVSSEQLAKKRGTAVICCASHLNHQALTR